MLNTSSLPIICWAVTAWYLKSGIITLKRIRNNFCLHASEGSTTSYWSEFKSYIPDISRKIQNLIDWFLKTKNFFSDYNSKTFKIWNTCKIQKRIQKKSPDLATVQSLVISFSLPPPPFMHLCILIRKVNVKAAQLCPFATPWAV